MGEEYSHRHAAVLAAQLPRGSRCRAADDPHDEWDDQTWMLWRVHREITALRWSFVKYKGEKQPRQAPYPGQADDELAAERRYRENKRKVDEAFGISGGADD